MNRVVFQITASDSLLHIIGLQSIVYSIILLRFRLIRYGNWEVVGFGVYYSLGMGP